MKLILTQDVTGLGEPGDIVEVKDGYGRNYLVPRGLAMRWTRGAEKQIDAMKKAREVRQVRDHGEAEALRDQLEALSVRLPARAGESGRLFGSVSVADIVEAVKVSGGPVVDKRRIEVGPAIKTLGTHQVSVQLHDGVTATVNVDVVPA